MNRQQIETMVGPTWVDFMSPFMESAEMNNIFAKLKAERDAGAWIYPTPQSNIFRCFRETPLPDLRVVIVGQDPYPKAGYANGLAFGVDDPTLRTPPSLEKIIDAVEQDCYSGLMVDKPNFDKSLVSWAKQGALMLNAALTLPITEPEPGKTQVGSHIDLWAPFINYVIGKLCGGSTGAGIKKDIIYLAWGSIARDALKSVNTFFDFMPPACNHPSDAARKQIPWDCKHFSTCNSIITANRLGETIKW